MKQGVEKEDVYSSFTILFLSPSPHHLIFSPPHSHLFIFSIYHPLPRSPSFLLFFFLSFFFPSRITEKEENIFSSNQTMISRQWQEKEKLYFQYSPDYFSQYSRFAIFPPAIFSTKGREMKRDRFREERSDRTKKIVEGEGTAKMRQKRCDL